MNNKNYDDEYQNQFNVSDDSIQEGSSQSEELEISSNDSDVLDLNSFLDDTPQEEEEEKASDKKKSTSTRNKILKIILIAFLIFVIIGCLAVGGVVFYIFRFVDGTMDEDLDELSLNYTTTIYVQGDKGEWEEYQRLHGEFNRIWVDYNKELAQTNDPSYKGIPFNMANALVAVEDKRFNDHDGVDWRRTASALLGVLKSGSTSGHGGSSITQQLVRNLTDDRDRSVMRKLREIMRARYLEGEYSKETILECYMNTIPMGNGLYGIEVAAEYYFGKSCTELTLSECASLAGITNLPEYYRPDKNPENNLKRRNLILGLMLNQKLITQEEYDDAIDDELKVVADKSVLKETEINSYFVDALIEDVVDALVEKFGYEKEHAESNFYNSGYRIYATLDPDIQAAMESVYTDSKYSLTSKKGKQLQGSMTIMDYEGHVLGLIGGMGEKKENRGLNRATQSPRQPGSTIKPLAAYAPAIENDLITYSSILNDSNKKYNAGGKQWRPTNWYGGNYGNMTAKRALEMSVNTIPVYLVDLMTLPVSYNFLHETLGMESLNENDLYSYAALGMGGMNRGITTQESAAAFAMFGNGGRYYKPITFTEIYDQYGNLVLSNSSSPTVAIGEDTASIMNKMLQNVVYGPEGTGRAAQSFIPNMRIYAKTGTSNDNYNIWFVGGSPYYVASSWCGYDEDEKISKASQARTMWGAVMKKVHQNLPAKEFEVSEYVQCKLFCSETGLLAKSECPIGGKGWYKLTGQTYCTSHGGDNIKGTTESDANKFLSGSSDSSSNSSESSESETENSQNESSQDTSSGSTPTD